MANLFGWEQRAAEDWAEQTHPEDVYGLPRAYVEMYRKLQRLGMPQTLQKYVNACTLLGEAILMAATEEMET